MGAAERIVYNTANLRNDFIGAGSGTRGSRKKNLMTTGNSILKRLREGGPTISVGVITADLMTLRTEVALIEEAGVGVLHFDVMDGCFCPMMTVGPPFIKAVKTPLLKDVHLMIEEPVDKVAAYVAAGADMVTIHVEACRHPHRALQVLGGMANVNDPGRGLIRGAALNPGTPVEAVEPLLDECEIVVLLAVNPGWGGQQFIPSTGRRIAAVRKMIEQSGREILLEIDGGVNRQNIEEVARMGADLIVTGSAVFDGKAPLENARYMLNATAKLRTRRVPQ
jgi:ribulose-phosphate 3-epimerase